MPNAIGIDIGGTKTRAARVSAEGRILAHLSAATADGAQAVLASLMGMISELRDDKTTAVGIGAPGRVDAGSGQILSGGYVDLSVLPLNRLVHEAIGLNVFTDNDASMALVGEARCGAARGHAHVVMLTIGTGIGGAVMADGHIFRGNGAAGQLGHITVSAAGEGCNCGRHGCLESECSGTALRRLLGDFGFATGTPVGAVLRDRSPQAVALVQAWATPMRAGIDSLVAAFGPQIVVLGGGLGEFAVQALGQVPAISPWFQYRVSVAALGDDAGVIGAALAALEHRP